jgi:hypothetical protein
LIKVPLGPVKRRLLNPPEPMPANEPVTAFLPVTDELKLEECELELELALEEEEDEEVWKAPLVTTPGLIVLNMPWLPPRFPLVMMRVDPPC